MESKRTRTIKNVLSSAGFSTHDAAWLILLSATLFTLLLPSSSYVAALPLIKSEWNLSNFQSGVIYSSFMAGFVVSSLVIVPLTDRLGAPNILIGAVFVFTVSHILFPIIAQGIIIAILLRAVSGVGLLGVYMPGLRVISERFPQKGRGVAMGVFVSAFYAGANGSLAITGFLMSVMKWRTVYLIIALIATISVPFSYLMLRRHQFTRTGQSSGRLNIKALRNPRARYMILSYTLHVIEEHAVRTWLPTFLITVLVLKGMDESDAVGRAASIAGIALALGGVGPVMGGFFSDRVGRAGAASMIVAVGSICAWSIGWTTSLPIGLVVTISAIYGVAIAADSPIYSSAITEVTSQNMLGSTMAIQAFIGQMGGVLGPIAFGKILDTAPDTIQWTLTFSILGILALVSISSLQRFRFIS